MKHFDTLAKYEECLASGMSEQQARVQVKTWMEVYDFSREDLATKNDLKVLEADINSRFKALESDIDSKFRGVYVIGGAIFTVVCLPIIQNLLTKF